MSKSHLILLTKQANPTDVNTLKMDAQEAELENQFDLAMELWTRVLAASNSKLDPQAINAFGRIALKREKFEQNLPPQTQPITPSQPFTSRQSPTTETTPPQRDIEFLPIISNKTFSFETVRINKPWIVMKRDQREAEYFPIDLGGSMTLDLVKIPAGSFMMGSPDGEGYSSEKPQNRVILKEFWIGKYPVTQAQWKQVVTVLPKIGQHLKSDPSYFKKDNCPVEKVSWLSAQEFCKRLSLAVKRKIRLPSEAEWEYACRSGTTTPFAFGETISPKIANYDGNYFYGNGLKGEYREQTTSVGQFPANGWGLYDMHGNVWEWCQDDWHSGYQDALNYGAAAWQKTNDGKALKKVIRGGSWNAVPQDCRSANRGNYSRNGRKNTIGFRVVMSSQ